MSAMPQNTNPLRQFRLHLNLSQEEFGQLFDPPLKQSRLSQYELGIRALPVEVGKDVVKIAKRRRYRLSLDDLYG